MKLYSDPRLLSLGVVHGTTDRAMGNMRLAENTQALFDKLFIPEKNILRFKQVHSDTLVCAGSLQQARQIQANALAEADGWVLKGSGFGAAILTADCVPLILWDVHAQVVGLSHCGWRGVAAQLPLKTLQKMQEMGAKGPFSAWAGPHIQSCCFEVQQDVAEQFPGCVIVKEDKKFVDLSKAIKQQLLTAGLEERNIQLPHLCTCGDKVKFFSYRRDHTKDALLTFIYRP
ncbi:polyphenol oxidase family protein [Candidatus Avelusimicrobium sp.]